MVGATGSGRLALMQRIAKSIAMAALLIAVAAPNAFAADFISGFAADVWHDGAQTVVQTQAGSTPDTGVTDFTVDTGLGKEQIKNVRVDLPPGLISNPAATPQCTQAQFTSNTCDDKT